MVPKNNEDGKVPLQCPNCDRVMQLPAESPLQSLIKNYALISLVESHHKATAKVEEGKPEDKEEQKVSSGEESEDGDKDIEGNNSAYNASHSSLEQHPEEPDQPEVPREESIELVYPPPPLLATKKRCSKHQN